MRYDTPYIREPFNPTWCQLLLMTANKTRRLLLTLGLFSLAGLSAIWFLHWNSEESAVCEATIREALSTDGISHYVILQTTQPDLGFGISDADSTALGLPLSARASFTAKNLFRFHVPSDLSLPHPFIMVSQEEMHEAYLSTPIDSPKTIELKKFLGESWGAITLSRVGFDLGETHVVVYTQIAYCGTCGEGMYIYLSKESGVWHIVREAGTWIS